MTGSHFKRSKGMTKSKAHHLIFGSLVALVATTLTACATASGTSSGDLPSGTNKAPIVVGGVFSLTGPVAPFSLGEVQGLKFYFSQQNTRGGIDGHKVVFELKDDQSQTSTGRTVMLGLAADTNVLAVFASGEQLEQDTNAAIAHENGMSYLTFALAPDSEISSSGRGNWFRIGWSPVTAEGAVLAELKSRGVKRVALLYAQDADGVQGQQALNQVAPSMGIKVTTELSYPDGDPNPTVTVLRAVASKPDAYVIWDPASASEIGLIVKALRANGATQPIGAPESAATSVFLQEAGAHTSDVYYWGVAAVSGKLPATQLAVEQAMTKAGISVSDYNIAEYALGQIFGAAASDVLHAGKTLTRANLLSAIKNLRNLSTVAGNITYAGPNPAAPQPDVPVIEYVNGRTDLVGYGS